MEEIKEEFNFFLKNYSSNNVYTIDTIDTEKDLFYKRLSNLDFNNIEEVKKGINLLLQNLKEKTKKLENISERNGDEQYFYECSQSRQYAVFINYIYTNVVKILKDKNELNKLYDISEKFGLFDFYNTYKYNEFNEYDKEVLTKEQARKISLLLFCSVLGKNFDKDDLLKNNIKKIFEKNINENYFEDILLMFAKSVELCNNSEITKNAKTFITEIKQTDTFKDKQEQFKQVERCLDTTISEQKKKEEIKQKQENFKQQYNNVLEELLDLFDKNTVKER